MRRGIETPAHFRCLQFVRKEAGKVRVRVVCIQFGQRVVEGSEETWEREEAKRVRPLCLFKFTDFQLLYWLHQLVW